MEIALNLLKLIKRYKLYQFINCYFPTFNAINLEAFYI